jgi:ArsR family transcriptional regulator
VSSDLGPQAERVSEIFKVLHDPTRLAVFLQLMQGTRCNCELCDCLDLPMNLMSHHLKVLREAGLVHAQRDPADMRWVYYSINREALANAREALYAFFDPQRVGTEAPVCRIRT